MAEQGPSAKDARSIRWQHLNQDQYHRRFAMPGQMPGGTLDVTNIWVTEPPPADDPHEAIPQGGEFTLHARFTGAGTQWINMRDQAHHFHVYFHLEGIGSTEAEVDYGPVSMNLGQANVYDVNHTVTAQQNTLPRGLYRCGVTIEDQNWHGAVGFNEGLVIQIYEAPHL
jgi:hypothetical protein